MRKIEQAVSDAVQRCETLRAGNTVVKFEPSIHEEGDNIRMVGYVQTVYLHGHAVAQIDHTKGEIVLSTCGWWTNVTFSRLKAVLAAFGMQIIRRRLVIDRYGNIIADFSNGTATVKIAQP